MPAVLSYFIETSGKSVGHYVDSGLNAHQIRTLLFESKRPGRNEYRKLQNSLRDWEREGLLVRHYGLDSERQPFSPKGFRGKIDFIPIAPDPKVSRRLIEASLEKLGKTAYAAFESNDLSLMIVLAVNDGPAKFNILLSADAGAGSTKRALRVWRDFTAESGISDRFAVVKISHHGSIKNHVPELCQCKVDGSTVNIAAVSAGERFALPDRDVLRDFQAAGWTTMVTTVRKKQRLDRPVNLHVEGKGETTFHPHTLELKWTSDGKFSFGPEDAIVKRGHLSAYTSAQKKGAP